MPHWLIKAAVHRAISWLPRRQLWNESLRTRVTKSLDLTSGQFEAKLVECRRHLEGFLSRTPAAGGFTMLKLNTGWFPIIPLGLYLCGAQRVWTIDIDPLLRPARIQRMLEYFCALDRRNELKNLLPRVQAERSERARSLLPLVGRDTPGALLAQSNIQVIVRDAQHAELPAGSIDLLFSSGGLQYIPRPVLQRIPTESRRPASPRAVISHRLNLVDQFSDFDRSIAVFNYLRYPARQRRWRNSPSINQNRLRISDYRQLLGEAGFEIVREESISGSHEELARVKLAPEFEHYAKEDLLVVHSFLTARVAASQQQSLQAGVAKP